MKVYYIDVVNKVVTEIKSEGKLADLQHFVGGYIENIPKPPINHALYVNEEGRLEEKYIGSFCFEGDGPYLGNGVLVGMDEDGDSVSPTEPLKTFQDSITFIY